jgi:hypothetical protein
MASLYTGVPTAAQSPSPAPSADGAPILSLPSDGDAANAASIAQAFKALADFSAWSTGMGAGVSSNYFFSDDFPGPAVNTVSVWTQTLSGAGAITDVADAGANGSARLASGAGSANLSIPVDNLGTKDFRLRCKVKASALGSGATTGDEIAFYVGGTHQVGLIIRGDLGAPTHWYATDNDGGLHTFDSGVVGVGSSYQILEIQRVAGTTNWLIAGSVVHTDSTSRDLGTGNGKVNLYAGASAGSSVPYFDWVKMWISQA